MKHSVWYCHRPNDPLQVQIILCAFLVRTATSIPFEDLKEWVWTLSTWYKLNLFSFDFGFSWAWRSSSQDRQAMEGRNAAWQLARVPSNQSFSLGFKTGKLDHSLLKLLLRLLLQLTRRLLYITKGPSHLEWMKPLTLYTSFIVLPSTIKGFRPEIWVEGLVDVNKT